MPTLMSGVGNVDLKLNDFDVAEVERVGSEGKVKRRREYSLWG